MNPHFVPKEAEFKVEQRIKSPPGELLGNFFIAEKPTMGFSLTEMLGRYLRKWFQNTRDFYIQTELKVIRIQNCLFTSIFNVQDDTCLLWQLKSFTIIVCFK